MLLPGIIVTYYGGMGLIASHLPREPHQSDASELEIAQEVFLITTLAGVGMMTGGMILKRISRRTVERSVDIHNRGLGLSYVEIDFGITPSGGLGFVVRF